MDPSAAMREFELGALIAPPRRLGGLSGADVWALSTTRGRWVAKVSHPPYPPARAEILEARARAAGVDTAAPVLPRTPAPGSACWAQLGAARVRVWQRVEGAAPRVPAGPELSRWLGRTVATLGTSSQSAEPEPPRPERTVGDPRLAGVVRELAAVEQAAWACRPATALSHRDISWHNILVCADRTVLLDFDHAGPQAPWWELVHHGFLLSCRDLGPEEPDPRSIATTVEAYANHGGVVGPADVTAFGGLVGGLLDWVGTGDAAVAQATVSLPLVAASLERWSALLR